MSGARPLMVRSVATVRDSLPIQLKFSLQNCVPRCLASSYTLWCSPSMVTVTMNCRVMTSTWFCIDRKSSHSETGDRMAQSGSELAVGAPWRRSMAISIA